MAENIVELLTDVADAIREKKGSTEPINAQNFAEEIRSIEGGGSAPRWTGHADAEGLKAIGWTDEDIAYYQEHGVNWNEEDDEYHKVSEDNKALYGVLTANNIADYKDRIVYLPKIDTSGKKNLSFDDCTNMVGVPMLNTQSFTAMNGMFRNCKVLTTIPPLATNGVTNISYMFQYCHSLVSLPKMDFPNATAMIYVFQDCYSLKSFSISKNNAPSIKDTFYRCYSLEKVTIEDASLMTTLSGFYNCFGIKELYINDWNVSLELNTCASLTMSSLLHIIKSEKATTAVSIKLHADVYTVASFDVAIQAALAAHPNVSLAK